jgi:hypothetical protein
VRQAEKRGMTIGSVIVSAVRMALINNVPFRHRTGEAVHSSVPLSQCNRFPGEDPNTGTSEYEITVRLLLLLIWLG